MYIQPNTTVRLLSNVPITNNYKHTLSWASQNAQQAYFISKTVHLLQPPNTYQRVKGSVNTIKLGIVADSCYNCNYIMYQNTNFSGKWFYGFITNVEYINNETSMITYEIDVIQTWYFDASLKSCYVEREHVSDDAIGANTVPEPVEVGYDYVDGSFDFDNSIWSNYSIVIAHTLERSGSVGGMKGGLYSGCNYDFFDLNSGGAVFASAWLNVVVDDGREDSVVAIFLMPSEFATDGEAVRTRIITQPKFTSNINGYVPRNNKLYTYPYNYLYCHDGGGTARIYKYELFSGSDCSFRAFCGMSPNPEIILEPNNYRNSNRSSDDGLVLNGFPQCTFTIDSFRAWLAQESSSTVLKFAGASVGALASAATFNVPGAIAGTLGAASIVDSAVKQKTNGNSESRGVQGNSSLVADRRKGFHFIGRQIRAEYARQIDDFFTVYGYQVNRMKVPNVRTRAQWNYVKTNGAIITGGIPSDDLAKACNILDTGITFWTNGDNVGNYGLANG